MTDTKAKPQQDTSTPEKQGGVVAFVKDVVSVVAFYLVFTTFAFGAFHIPTGSMEPTLEVGDRIFVSKYAYGYNRYSFPFDPGFIPEGKLLDDALERGDIAVFTLPYKNSEDFIKRVVGLPGDTIQMKKGRLIINGKLVPRTFVRDVTYVDYRGRDKKVKEYDETLPGGVAHRIYEETDSGYADNTGLFVVPSGHYFMMGDNRDGSADSRFMNDMGFVKHEYVIGRAEVTTFSLFDCDQGKDVYCPAGIPLGRFFNSLN